MAIADYLRWPPRRGRGRGLDALAESARAVEPLELAARRDELSAELTELQWDLGGLTYEMARRDHFRLDVLVRQAAKLQGVDAELGEVERLLHLEQAGAGGTCPACGALHARGAVYCWQCGADLMAQQPVGTAPPADGNAASSAPLRGDPLAQPAQAPAPAGPPPPAAQPVAPAPVSPPAVQPQAPAAEPAGPVPAPPGQSMPEIPQPPPSRRFAPPPPRQPGVGGAEEAPPPVSEPPASSARTGAAGI